MMDAQQAEQVLARSRLLHSAEAVAQALDRMATQINQDYAGRDPLVFCVMNGAIIVAGQLLPRLNFPFRLEYLHATRYREKTRGADLHWIKTADIDMQGRAVLILDDILDEGETLAALAAHCRDQQAASVASAVLTRKQHARGNGFSADYVGLEVEDVYVFGMGMDYQGYLRHLPAIYAIDES